AGRSPMPRSHVEPMRSVSGRWLVVRNGFIAVAIGTVASGTPGPGAPVDAGYVAEIQQGRAEKDRVFAADTGTIPAEKRAALLPLRYFPVDPAFSVPAALPLSEDRPVFEMPTSTGTMRKMQRVGVLEFTLLGQPRTLE